MAQSVASSSGGVPGRPRMPSVPNSSLGMRAKKRPSRRTTARNGTTRKKRFLARREGVARFDNGGENAGLAQSKKAREIGEIENGGPMNGE